MEQWKQIGTFDSYAVSREGKVMGRKGILKPCEDSNGYLQVRLAFEGKAWTYKVHRLVAEAFIDNPLGYNFVKHIDGDRYNNHVDNLQWVKYRAPVERKEPLPDFEERERSLTYPKTNDDLKY